MRVLRAPGPPNNVQMLRPLAFDPPLSHTGPMSIVSVNTGASPAYASLGVVKSYAHLSDISPHPGSLLFPSSWCPSMDLFVLAAPLSNRHRLTLWKMGGTKLWDVEVGRGEAQSERIVDVAWSPSGTSSSRFHGRAFYIDASYYCATGLEIAVVHHPPRVSVHSVHTGQEFRCLPIPAPGLPLLDRSITGVWWLEDEKNPKEDALDKLLQRRGNTVSVNH